MCTDGGAVMSGDGRSIVDPAGQEKLALSQVGVHTGQVPHYSQGNCSLLYCTHNTPPIRLGDGKADCPM